MLIILSAVCLILILQVIVRLYKHKRKFRSLKDVPGPKPYPIIGNIFDFGFNSVDILRNLTKISELGNPFVKYTLGPVKTALLTTDPEFTEFILSSPKYLNKSDGYDLMKDYYLNGLLTSHSSLWQKRRKIIAPAFHYKMLEGFVKVYNSETMNLVERLSKHVSQEEFNIHSYISNFMLDTICETAMGISENVRNTASYIEFTQNLQIIHEIFVSRIFSWKKFNVLFRLSNDYKVLQKALKYTFEFTKYLISERRKILRERKNENEIQRDDVGLKKKQVFLDILLNAAVDGIPLTDEDILEEVNTFISGGHETTASTLAFTMHELSRNPEIQDKIFSEIKEIFCNDKNYEPTFQDLNSMKYTELVIKEILRLYPVPYIARQLEEDINYKDTLIPKDTTIFIFIFGMQRREDLFPNASKFDPDRFLSKDVSKKHYSYIPFSAGPRNCIGQKYAMNQLKTSISKIIMNFEILPASSTYDMQLSGEIILVPANGVYVKLKSRDKIK